MKDFIYIFTEGGRNIGYGHITRCISILQFYPHSKLIIFAKDRKNVEDFLKVQKVNSSRYSFYNWHFGNFPNIKNKIVFVDSYLAREKVLKKLEKLSKKLLFYDDYKQRNYRIFKKSIVINPSFMARKLFFYKQKNFLLGPKYLMLRRAFYKVKRKAIKDNIKNVFLSLGGNSHKEKNILIKKIKRFLEKYNFNIIIPQGLDDEGVKKLMENSDIAICAGGQTILELSRMGVPTISICLADNQLPTLQYLKNKKLTFFVGWYFEKNILEKIEKFIQILNDKAVREDLSIKLQNLIDGKGTLRIINAALGKRIAP